MSEQEGTAVEQTAPDAAPEGTGFDIDAIIADSVKQNIPPQDDAPLRDEKGRFVKKGEPEAKEDGEAPTEAASDEAASDVSGEAKPDEGDTEKAEPSEFAVPIVKDRQLATEFTVKVGDKDVPVPELVVTYKAAGKERTEPLDKVVKLAQQGVYQHEREQRLQAVERNAQAVQQEAQSYKQRAEQMEEALEALLKDPDSYLNAKDVYDREQTPERQLARLQEEREAFERERQMGEMARQGTAYFQDRLMPALDQIANALPLVDTEELSARMMLELRPYTDARTGIIPPNAYSAVEAALLERVVPWAQDRQERLGAKLRESTATAEAKAKEAEAQAKAAQAAAQKAKNTVARAVAPTKGGQTAPMAKPKPIVTADDGIEASITEAIKAAMGG